MGTVFAVNWFKEHKSTLKSTIVTLCLLIVASCGQAVPASEKIVFSKPTKDLQKYLVTATEELFTQFDETSTGLDIEDSTVLITGRHHSAFTTRTGVWVENNVLTAYHVVAGETFFLDGSSMVVDVAWEDRELDLAVVCTPGSGINLSFGPPTQIGDIVFTGGYPGGGPYQQHETRVAHLNDGSLYGLEGTVIVLKDPMASGMSGGPVVDEQGRLAGVLVANEQLTNMGIAIPVSLDMFTFCD